MITNNYSLTINGYECKLNKPLKFYQGDSLHLIFTVNQYEWVINNGNQVRAIMPINPLRAFLIIENPEDESTDTIESAFVENDEIHFHIDSKYTSFVGVGRMQLVLADDGCCSVTIPEFTYEIKKNITDKLLNLSKTTLIDTDNKVLMTDSGDDMITGLALSTESNTSKYIKDLPNKETIDGEESVLIQDQEGTKNVNMKVLLDDINSRTNLADIQNQITETNAQLSTINNAKMDKGGEIIVSQINKNKGKFDQTYMTDEFLAQIRGEAPVSSEIPDKGVTTEKLANFAVDKTKIQTTLQPISILNGKENELPNFDSVNKKFTIPYGGYDHIVYVGGKPYSGVRDVNVDLTTTSTAGKLVFNTTSKTFRACEWNDALDETIEVAVAYFRYADRKYIVNMPCRHTVDGKTPISLESLNLNHFDSNLSNSISSTILSVGGTSIDINDQDLWEMGSVSIDTQTWEKAKSSNNATDRIRMIEVMPIECGTYKIEVSSQKKVAYKLYKDLVSGAIDYPNWFTGGAEVTVPVGGGYIGFLMQSKTTTDIGADGTIIKVTPVFEQLQNDIETLKTKIEDVAFEELQDNIESLKTKIEGITFKEKSTNEVKMVAHRGLSYYYPENTMPSFYKACEYGFKYIETDVQVTSDGKFVIMHDQTVDRTTNGVGKVNEMTLKEITTLTVDSGKGIENYPNLKVPTLDQFLKLCRENGVTPVLELKFNYTETNIEALLKLVKSYGLNSCELIVSSDALVGLIRKFDSSIIIHVLKDLSVGNIDYCYSMGDNTYIAPSYAQATSELVEYAHSIGVKVNCWTVNNVYDYQDLMTYGVDYITTDYLMHNQQLSSIKEMQKIDSGSDETVITMPSAILNNDVYEVSVEILHKSGSKPYLKSWGYQMNYPENASGWIQLKMQVHARTKTVFVKSDDGDFEFRNFKVIHHKM